MKNKELNDIGKLFDNLINALRDAEIDCDEDEVREQLTSIRLSIDKTYTQMKRIDTWMDARFHKVYVLTDNGEYKPIKQSALKRKLLNLCPEEGLDVIGVLSKWEVTPEGQWVRRKENDNDK